VTRLEYTGAQCSGGANEINTIAAAPDPDPPQTPERSKHQNAAPTFIRYMLLRAISALRQVVSSNCAPDMHSGRRRAHSPRVGRGLEWGEVGIGVG